jgi:hypothetical protein
VHAILALVLLLAATVLAIYKPFGMTPYGMRAQMRARMAVPALVSTTVETMPEPTPRGWEYLLWIVGLTILGLIIVSHLLGSGTHGH